jgi:integrase
MDFKGVMSVRKRKWTTASGEQKEAWVVAYSNDGKRHIKTFDRKKDADAFHDDVRGEVRRGDHIAPSRSETLGEAAARWINRVTAEGREATTVRQYEIHVRLHIAPRLGTVKLAQLNERRIEQFRDDLLASGMTRAMVRKVLTSLKSILKVAKRSHVAANVSVARDKRARKLEVGTDIPSPSEIKRLLVAVADSPLRMNALINVAIFTGLRASELRGLRWRDVSLKRGHGSVTVAQRADRFGKIGAPKSATSCRTIEIDDDVIHILSQWKLACPLTDGDIVFPTSAGTIENHANLFRQVEGVVLAARLTNEEGRAKYGLHALRHFFCSWCLGRRADGGRELPLDSVKRLMGHSSIALTSDVYGHLLPSRNDRSELVAASAALRA